MDIFELIEKLKKKSEVNPHKGMGGTEVVVDKDLLRLAATYLEDYMVCIGEM